jgi:hypothetical protein
VFGLAQPGGRCSCRVGGPSEAEDAGGAVGEDGDLVRRVLRPTAWAGEVWERAQSPLTFNLVAVRLRAVTPKKKRVVAATFLVIVSSIFTAGMLLVGGIVFAGAGHGTYFFSYIVAGPAGADLLIWPLMAGMLPWRQRRPISVSILIASILPILWAAYVYIHLGDESDYFFKVLHREAPVALGFLVFFFAPSLLGILLSIKHAFILQKPPMMAG